MIHYFCLFVLVLTGQVAAGQNVDVTICLKMQDSGEPVNGYKLRITGTDGSDTTITTDITGTINFRKGYFIPGHLYTVVSANSGVKYLPAVADQFSTQDVVSNTRIIRELHLMTRCSAGNPKTIPTLRIKGLSTLIDQAALDSLSYLYALMIENPSMVISVISLFQNEKDLTPFKRRSDIIKTQLTEMGIPGERIVTRIETYDEQHDPYIRSRKAGNVIFEIESMDYVRVVVNKPKIDLSIRVMNLTTALPQDSAKVTLVGSDGKKSVRYTNKAGRVTYLAADNTNVLDTGQWYTLEVQGILNKYLDAQDFVSTVGIDRDTLISRELSVVCICKSIRPPSLQITNFSENLDASQRDSIQYMYDLMIENPTMEITITSLYSTERDTAPFKRQSEMLKAQLLQKGIAPDRIKTAILKYDEHQDEEVRLRKKGNVIFEITSFDYVPHVLNPDE
jgi:hypothetical protein